MINKLTYKSYCSIDIFKLMCSLLVVFLHCYCNDLGEFGYEIKETLCNLAVPFFFINSGFFLFLKLDDKTKNDKEYIINYIKRFFIMYLFWSILTLPVSIYNFYNIFPNGSLILLMLYLIKCFFFVGSLGIYWYILSLILDSLIIYMAYKNNKLNILFFLSFILFIIGVLFKSHYLPDSIYKIIDFFFSSERNFLNVGLFYMTLGCMFVKYVKVRLNLTSLIFWFIVCSFIKFIEIKYCSIHFIELFQSIFLFLIALNINVELKNDITIKIRKISTIIYLVHFPFILCFDFYLKKGTIIDFLVTLTFCILISFILLNNKEKTLIKKII